MHSISLALENEDQTQQFGQRLGKLLRAGDVIALIGELGAGKTHLAQAIATALEIDASQVSSPTFALIQEHRGRLPLRHCDAYRLRDPHEFADLGLDELFAMDGVAIVEWADRVLADLPRDRLEIRITATGPRSRSVELFPTGIRSRELVDELSRSPLACKI